MDGHSSGRVRTCGPTFAPARNAHADDVIASAVAPRGFVMKIEYFHASKFGNGAMVADEFRKQMAAKGITVNVHHIRQARPRDLPNADLYLFSSPGRIGKPIG